MAERISVWILGDQLHRRHAALALAQARPDAPPLQVVLVESDGRVRRQPYHRKKLALLFSAMRHYGQALEEQGVVVDYVEAASFRAGLERHVERFRPHRLLTMAAKETATRRTQEGRLARWLGIPVEVLPNTQFIQADFDPEPGGGGQSILEHYYRRMRRHFGVLMGEDGGPEGGQWNFDRQNRKPLPAQIEPPPLPRFQPDTITLAAMEKAQAVPGAVGEVRDFDLAVTHGQAEQAAEAFFRDRLRDFGPYEDAMSSRSGVLFHSLLAPYLNLGLLEPMPLISRAQEAYSNGEAPINSVEGFIRQILGWREYIYWQYHRQMPGLWQANGWAAHRPMPQMFWDGETPMNCIGHLVRQLLKTGYTHHIERLMVVCNFCLLAGISPKAVAKWFLAFYVDAYEWVVLPNVIGMGLNADQGRTATKPYLASANYINKMGDYCAGCALDPKQRTGPRACPFNFLYWHFLLEHEDRLRANPRLGPNVLGLRHLDPAERQRVREQSRRFLQELSYYGEPAA